VSTKDTIRDFIIEELCPDEAIETLGDDEQFIETGIIDSMGILNLLAFLQSDYGILLADGDLNRENSATLQRICDMVAKRSPQADPSAGGLHSA